MSRSQSRAPRAPAERPAGGSSPDEAQTTAALSPDAIRDRIRAAGLRVTPGRVATYAALHAAAQPLTHADVVAKLDGAGFDPATVYRNLIDLTDAGLLARSDLGDHAWRFELEGRHTAQHPHFICVDCGEISCLEGVAIEVRGKRVPRAVSKDDVQVQIRGRCDTCS